MEGNYNGHEENSLRTPSLSISRQATYLQERFLGPGLVPPFGISILSFFVSYSLSSIPKSVHTHGKDMLNASHLDPMEEGIHLVFTTCQALCYAVYIYL